MDLVIKEQRPCWIRKRRMRWEAGGRSNSSFKTKSEDHGWSRMNESIAQRVVGYMVEGHALSLSAGDVLVSVE